MKRKIIDINESKCNGCGLCIPNCPEGAIQLIDGKARLLGDLFCDGLGACLGECPEGAITITEREAEPYNEEKAMENIMRQGESTIRAHLEHLQSHGETELHAIALAVLKKHGQAMPGPKAPAEHGHHEGCPGARTMTMKHEPDATPSGAERPSRLGNWPVQLHLLPPRAPFFKDRDLVLSADCVAYAAGDFHERFISDKAVAIACPKLDEGQEIYLEKLKTIIDEAGIRSLTVLTMEVPCCSGLARLVGQAVTAAERKDLPVVWQVVNLQGETIRRDVIQ